MPAIAEFPARNAEFESRAPRLPPQALEAEQSVLGGLLLDGDKWDEVAGEVGAEDFYHNNHRLIFSAVAGLQRNGQPVDLVTVEQQLQTEGHLAQIGGLAYLSTLANNTPSTVNLAAYAKIVREQAVLRSLIAAANRIAEKAYTPRGVAPNEVLDFAEQQVFAIAERDGRRRRGFAELRELVTHTMDYVEDLHERNDPITGVATGFADIDAKTAGLQRGDLVIIAGRPSMGKTALALNIAEYAAIQKKMPVALFSMEMSGEQLAMRMLASIGRIDSNKVRTGRLDDADWPRLAAAAKMLNDAPIYVDDSSGLNPLELRSRARDLARQQQQPLGLVIVDYLQLMQSGDNNENRATEVSNITRSLKMLAKELNAPLIALSQLNRGLENRPSKRPQMADLRESGAIEQDADVIFFIYRDEVYNQDSDDLGVAEIIIGKQRNGPIGTTKLTFLGQFTRFEDYQAPTDSPYPT